MYRRETSLIDWSGVYKVNAKHFYPAGRFLLVAACFFLGILAAKYAFLIFYPFIIAFLIAWVINPAVQYLERTLKLPRPISVLVIMLAIMLFFLSGLVLAVMELIQGAVYLADALPGMFQQFLHISSKLLNEQIMPLYGRFLSLFQSLDPGQQTALQKQAEAMLAQLVQNASFQLQQVLWKLPEWFMIVPNSLTSFMFSFLASFFMAKDWHYIHSIRRKFVPERTDRHMRSMLTALKETLIGFMKAQGLLLTITGIIVFVGLVILQVRHALAISFTAVAIDLIPYAGTGLLFVPWIGFTFLNGNYGLTIGLCLLYGFIVIMRQLLEPKLLSSGIGLNPLAMLAAMFAGMKLGGMAGLLFAPLALMFVSAMHKAGITYALWSFIKG